MNIPINHFDRSKIFYPYIINYIATFHSLVDLSSLAISQLLEKIPNEDPVRLLWDIEQKFIK